jgi:multidrug efflux pump subunit AcrA (membrane-fusion protein)
VEAALDSYPNWKMAAKVIAIIPSADRQKATVKVRVGFEKLDPRILPQMGVKVAFRGMGEAPAAARALVIPKFAVKQIADRQVVFVLQNGRVERRAVTLGPPRQEEVTVISGLADGEKIVVSNLDGLTEGARVKELKP